MILLPVLSRLNVLVSKSLYIELNAITIAIFLYILRPRVRAALSHLVRI